MVGRRSGRRVADGVRGRLEGGEGEMQVSGWVMAEAGEGLTLAGMEVGEGGGYHGGVERGDLLTEVLRNS